MHPEKIGPYRIIKPIGAGAMGEVFLGEDETLGRQAAIKTLPEEFGNDPVRRQRFMQEAQSASAINHPNACTIYGVGETEDGDAFIAMEYVEGNTLKSLISNGPLALELTTEFSTQIADALDEAHKVGVVHRDIKSANVIVNQRGQAKVLDFGLAKKLDEDEDIDATRMVQTQDGQIIGTPGYMSPEQATGKDVDVHQGRRSKLVVNLAKSLTMNPNESLTIQLQFLDPERQQMLPGKVQIRTSDTENIANVPEYLFYDSVAPTDTATLAALTMYLHGNLEDAEKFILMSAAEDNLSLYGWILLANIEKQKNNLEEAVRWYRQIEDTSDKWGVGEPLINQLFDEYHK